MKKTSAAIPVSRTRNRKLLLPVIVLLVALAALIARIAVKAKPRGELGPPTQSVVLTEKSEITSQEIRIKPDSIRQEAGHSDALKRIEKAEYRFRKIDSLEKYSTPNRKNNLRFFYDESGFTVEPRTTKIAAGKPVDPLGLPHERPYKNIADWKVNFLLDKQQIGAGVWEVNENKAEYTTDNITVQYLNDEEGMRQNFIVRQPLMGSEKLDLHFSVNTILQQQFSAKGLEFVHPEEGIVLQYHGLKVWDANGKALEAEFVQQEENYSISVNTANARYPITIDPISNVPAALIERDQPEAQVGFSVDGAGDINHDGYDDIIVGAPYFDNGLVNQGAAFIFYGGPEGINPGDFFTPVLSVLQAECLFGYDVAGAGDLDKDGYDDIIIGAPYWDGALVNSGASFIFFGAPMGEFSLAAGIFITGSQTGALAGYSVDGAHDFNNDGNLDIVYGLPNHSINAGAPLSGAWAIGRGDGNRGFTVNVSSQSEANAKIGWSVAGTGDVDGDGLDEVIVGAPGSSELSAGGGAMLIVYGRAQIGLGVYSYIGGTQANSNVGYSVGAPGDVNGDGLMDMLLGTPYFDQDFMDEGRLTLIYGHPSGYNLVNVRFYGGQPGALLGWSCDGIGDVNGDGRPDFAGGAPYYEFGQNNEGAAFIYYSNTAGIPFFSGETMESNQAESLFGWSVAGVGDVNGDGQPDMAVGAPLYDNGQFNEGRVFVYHGKPNPQGSGAIVTAQSNQVNAQMGMAVSSAGDINGDGFSDVIAGAPDYDNPGTDNGALLVYYGTASGINTTTPTIISPLTTTTRYASAISTAGDINGDGFSDVIVGAPLFGSGQVAEGAAYIYLGSASGLSTVPATIIEGNMDAIEMGFSVACAGDINGDGFSDVLIGARHYTNGQFHEGAAFLYYGSASGLVTATRVTLETNFINALYGSSVAGAGDINGDGFSDIVVGGPQTENGQTAEGAAWIYYGTAAGLSTTGTMLENNIASGTMGNSVAGAGDVNGDGYGDVIIGSSGYQNPQAGEGTFYIYHGTAAGIMPIAASRVEGNQAAATMGWSVASAGDVNGDGYADVVSAALNYSKGQSNEGVAFIYYGSPAGIGSVAQSLVETNQVDAKMYAIASAGDVNGDGYSDIIFGIPNFSGGELNEGGIYITHGAATNIHGTHAFKVERNQAGSELGYTVANVGDVNGDGFSDMVVAAPKYDLGQTDEGVVFLYLGSASGLFSISTTIQRDQAGALFGSSVAGAGDVNGDGYADIIIGAPGYNNNGQPFEGAAFVYYGASGGLLTMVGVLKEPQAFSLFGQSVNTAGDINGDGLSDVIIGAPFFSDGQSNEGVAFVYYGTPTGVNIDGWLLQCNQAGAGFGISVSSAGDINGDGFGDVAIGASNYDNGQSNEGAVFIHYGIPLGFSGVPAVVLEMNQADAYFGSVVACAGDVNGNGYNDLIVSAPSYDNGQNDEGAVFVYHVTAAGIATTPATTLEINQADANFGQSISSAGDVNGDGYSDILVSSVYYDNPEISEGVVKIYLGSPSGINSTAARSIEGNQAIGWFGSSVSGGGDINGDGFSDIIVGSSLYDNGQTDEGAVFVYYGNSESGFKRNNIDLYNSDLVTPVNRNNFTDNNYGAGLFAKSFLGRGKGKMVWETRKSSVAFSGSPITNSNGFTAQQNNYADLGLTGIELKNTVAKPYGRYTKIRARVKYNPATAITGQLYGPWRYVPEQVSGVSLGTLPVDLLSFKVAWEQTGQIAKVSFTTDNETAILRYELEKSTDGVNFAKFGELAPNNIQGVHNYSYPDSNATADKQYYRLRTIHQAGAPSYSKIELLKNSRVAEITLYPNPATDMVNLKLINMNGKFNVQIVNGSGQTIKQLTNLSAMNQVVQIPVSDLPAGMYYLYLYGEEERQVLKFMKQ